MSNKSLSKASSQPTIDVDYVINLLTVARKNAEKKNLDELLISAILYANIAEYLTEKLIYGMELQINYSLELRKPKLSISIELKDKKTNLESQMSRLKKISFPRKEDLSNILGKIKESRNTLFHDIVAAPSKKIDLKNEIKKIAENTEKFIELYFKISDEIEPADK